MKKQKNKQKQVPVAGSLGVLALGHMGIDIWRRVKQEAEEKEKTSNNSKSK